MDYEKAYKAVLQTAAQWIKDGCTDKEKICLECVFPELRESEDERIRKFLKDYAIEMIAGLESDISISVYDGVKGHDPDAEEELEKWREARAWLEKQKPMYNLEIPSGDVAPAEEDGPFDEDDFLENELSAFLQNYDKEYDDDAAVSDVARHFYEIGKKQKEQKPAWSEEDADMLNCCISSIEEAKENRYAYNETDGDTSYDREIDWLKSLRPSWKPSDQDELMKLKYAGTSTKLD